ncbi:MAG: TolC family protein [bacterium]
MFRNRSVCLWLIVGFIGITTGSAPLPGQETPSVENVTPAEQPDPIAVPAAPETVETPTAPPSSPPASGQTVTIQTGVSNSPVMVQMQPSAGGETTLKIGDEKGDVQETAFSPADAPRRSIAIMANVLDHMLSEKLGDDYRSKGVLSSGCRGYWIPEDGAVFLLEVKFPLQDSKAAEEVKREEGDKDLWDQYEEKLSGEPRASVQFFGETVDRREILIDPFSGVSLYRGRDNYNPEKVENLKNALLTALAQYGHRLQGIPGEGTVTVIVDSSSSPDLGVEVLPRFNKMIERRAEEGDTDFKARMESVQLSLKEWEDQLQNRQQYLDLVKKQMELAHDRVKRTEQLVQTGRASQAELDDVQNQALESQKALLEAEKTLHEAENQLTRARQEFDNLRREQELQQERNKLEEQQRQSQEGMQSRIDTIREQARVFKQIMGNETDERAMDEAKAQLKDLQAELSDFKKLKDFTLPIIRDRIKAEIEKEKEKPDAGVILKVAKGEDNGDVTQLVTISPGSNVAKPVSTMILRVPFKDLPKAKGEAKDLEGKVKITVY